MSWRAGHHVTFRLDKYFGVRTEFSCDEPDHSRSWCRKVCGKDCEEWSEDHDAVYEHGWVYRAQCNVLDWLDNGEETYAGPDLVVAQSGPIEVAWDSGGYVWRLVPQEDLAGQVRLLKESLREVVIELEQANMTDGR